MANAKVNARVKNFLAHYFETHNLTSRGEMVAAAMQFFAVLDHFGKRKSFARLKREAAELLYEATGSKNPDYSPESKVETIRFMGTVLFNEETTARVAA